MSGASNPLSQSANVIFVGGDAASRAEVCSTASETDLRIEPAASAAELLPRDFAAADVFLVWNDPELLEQVRFQLATTRNHAALVAFYPNPSTNEVVAALLAGAMEFVDWPCSPRQLESSINAAIEKRRTFMPRWERARRANARLGRLTRRECEVIVAIAYGLSNKQAAGELGLSPRTVEGHRADAIRKLEVEHSIDAVRLVFEATTEECAEREDWKDLAVRLHRDGVQAAAGDGACLGPSRAA